MGVIADSAVDETDPAWSPDGRQLAYVAPVDSMITFTSGTGNRTFIDLCGRTPP